MSSEVDKVIKIAEAEVGYLEKKTNANLDSKTANAGSNNYTKYARDLDAISGWYNGKKQGYAWCDIFVDWCFVQAFGKDRAKVLLCQTGTLGAGCTYSRNYYKNKGQLYTSNPKAGDQIFFKNAIGAIVHTGLVYKVDNNYVYTIEGNTSSSAGVVANGGSVNKKKYKLTYNLIAGYGRPKYTTATATTTTTTTTTTKTKTVTANSGLHLRASAKTSATSLGVYKKGTKVTIITENCATSNGYKWDKVKISGKTGYMANTYLK